MSRFLSDSVRHYLKLLWLPLTLLVVFVGVEVMWQVFGLPPPKEFLDPVRSLFETYGLPALFIVAVVEAMLLVGGYFPGGTVIVVAVILADTVPQAMITVAVAVFGLFFGHICNYLLGRYGWYKLLAKFNASGSIQHAEERLQKRGLITAFGTYWLSSVAAIIDTAAGVLRYSWYRFLGYSFMFTLFWGVFFGILAYLLGGAVLQPTGSNTSDFLLMIGILLLWMAGLVIWDWYTKSKD